MRIVPGIECIALALIIGLLSTNAAPSTSSTQKHARSLKIAIIGAGASGLASAKNAREQGHHVVIYERSETLGGIWWYTDETGRNKYGVNVHTPMYQGLRSNGPYQLMEYPGFPYPKNTQSYPTQQVVWKYLDSFAEHFHLKNKIKYLRAVENVVPVDNNKWRITVRCLRNDTIETGTFDAVFVCSGATSSPKFPRLPGLKNFRGTFLHSRSYRKAEKFRGKTVLVIGSGTSAHDIVLQLSGTAKRVTFSQYARPDESNEDRKKRLGGYGKNVIHKYNVNFLTTDGAEFTDETQQTFDVIICATGYETSYPFLNAIKTGITCTKNFVQPLYKGILNIEHPTMAFIGIALIARNNMIFDLQARFALKFISGAKKLPSRKDMYTDMEIYGDILQREQEDIDTLLPQYYQDLADTAEIDGVPEIFRAIYIDSLKTIRDDPFGYRKYKYTITNNGTAFKRELEVRVRRQLEISDTSEK